MKPALDRAEALLGGTDAMRAAGEQFLPRFPGEVVETYNWRLKVATLNNFYQAMALQMVGLIFAEAVKIENSKIPDAILNNIDKRGNSVNSFAAELAKALLTKGRPHILVDYPKRLEGAQTLADDQAAGVRPYWVAIEPRAVFFAYAETKDGEEKLGHIRWTECASTLAVNAYEAGVIDRIRLLKLNEQGEVVFEKWERSDAKAQYALVEEGAYIGGGAKPLKEVPMVTLYSDRKEFMVAKPTLDDVAHKNIEHWQSSADQRHILTVTRFPILYQLGTKGPVALVGPYSMFHTDADKNTAEIGYAEAEGKGIAAGAEDMKRLVSEAEAMAVRIVTSDAAKTESGEQIDHAKEGAPLQKISGELERGLQQALIYTARWLGLPDEQAGTVTVNKDFGISGDDLAALTLLNNMRANGDISQPTLWREADARGLFLTEFSAKKEQTLVEDEKQQAIDRQLTLMPPPVDPNADPNAPPANAPPANAA